MRHKRTVNDRNQTGSDRNWERIS